MRHPRRTGDRRLTTRRRMKPPHSAAAGANSAPRVSCSDRDASCGRSPDTAKSGDALICAQSTTLAAHLANTPKEIEIVVLDDVLRRHKLCRDLAEIRQDLC